MCPGEFFDRLDAWQWRQTQQREETYEREAWKLTHILSPYASKGKRVRPTDFYRKPDEFQGDKIAELARRLEAKRG